MKPIFVVDDYTLINTQGIRFVEKIDSNQYGYGRSNWHLVVTYRKERMLYHYPNENLRDAQYLRLREVLEKEYGMKKENNK